MISLRWLVVIRRLPDDGRDTEALANLGHEVEGIRRSVASRG
jgi:hypothetical protein